MALDVILGVGSLAASVFGIGAGVAGASASNKAADKAAKAQYDQAKEIDEFDWESTLRKYEYAQAVVDLQRQTSANVHNYKTELAAQGWQQQMAMREFEYKNSVEAFNKSEEQFEDQRAVNTISSIIATEEATRSFNEAQLSMNFEQESMARDLTQALNVSAFVKADIERERNSAIGSSSIERRKNELGYQMQAVDSAFKSQENMVASLLGEGQARSRGTGRSTGKAIQSVLAQAGRQQAQITQNMADAGRQFQIQARSIDHTMVNAINNADLQDAKEDNNIDYKREQYNQGLRELQASMDSAGSAFRSNMMKIDRDKQVADMQAHYNRMLEPSMGPEIPKPIELPQSVFLDPLPPVRGPKPQKHAPQTQSSWTTFANAASGVGDAIGTVGQIGQMAGWF